jgi:phosphoenolpyruvate carboxylase
MIERLIVLVALAIAVAAGIAVVITAHPTPQARRTAPAKTAEPH